MYTIGTCSMKVNPVGKPRRSLDLETTFPQNSTFIRQQVIIDDLLSDISRSFLTNSFNHKCDYEVNNPSKKLLSYLSCTMRVAFVEIESGGGSGGGGEKTMDEQQVESESLSINEEEQEEKKVEPVRQAIRKRRRIVTGGRGQLKQRANKRARASTVKHAMCF